MMLSNLPSTHYITRLRFPLAVAVVFIHSMGRAPLPAHASDFSLLDVLRWWCSGALPTFAVPLFFCISGFLFFRGSSATALPTWENYRTKWRRRVSTLLVPYLVWNVLRFLLYWGRHDWDSFPLRWQRAGGWNIFWGSHDIGRDVVGALGIPLGHLTAPIDVPLWFVRDLMVMVLFAPFLALWMRRPARAVSTLVFLLFLYVARAWPYIGGLSGGKCGLMFLLGMTAALHGIDLLRVVRPVRGWLYAATPLLLTVQFLTRGYMPPMVEQLLLPFTLFLGMGALIALAGEREVRVPSDCTRFLASSSFFLFAAHTVGVLEWVDAGLKELLPGATGCTPLLRYFLLPALTVICCLTVFALLRRFLPRLSAPLTGIHR